MYISTLLCCVLFYMSFVIIVCGLQWEMVRRGKIKYLHIALGYTESQSCFQLIKWKFFQDFRFLTFKEKNVRWTIIFYSLTRHITHDDHHCNILWQKCLNNYTNHTYGWHHCHISLILHKIWASFIVANYVCNQMHSHPLHPHHVNNKVLI